MLSVRRSEERGHADHGWLKSWHTFSFAHYFDPQHMGFGPLRVINEDRIEGGTGFGLHPHQDMEIITYVVKGALVHQDTMGNKTVIRPGDVQKMSAGRGVRHSEMNHEEDAETHLFQIWIQPNKKGVAPSYEQKNFADVLEREKLVLVASPDGRDGSIAIHQDAAMYVARLQKNSSLHLPLQAKRGVWIQVVHGSLAVNGTDLQQGDAVAVTKEASVELLGQSDTELILFDLPMA